MALSASPEPSDKGCLAFGLLWTMVKEELSWATQRCPAHDFQMRRAHTHTLILCDTATQHCHLDICARTTQSSYERFTGNSTDLSKLTV